MERLTLDPRPNWSSEIEKLGFDFYLMEGVPYWTENACYKFTAAEIDEIESATNKLHRLCLYAVEEIINRKLYPLLSIDPKLQRMIEESWKRRDPAIYGRFDLLYDGKSPPKMLEYNADTPTSLFEASIVQWNWREQKFPKADQFNSIHEHLVDRWRNLLVGRRGADMLYVTTATPMPEDEATVQYLGRTAQDAGYKTKFLPIQEIGWADAAHTFVDLDGQTIQRVFKLYPWEWLMKDDFGKHIQESGTLWLEPAWKMLLSNKGLLPILWEMFPEHENLLPAYREAEPLHGQPSVRKPMLGREGNNITIRDVGDNILAETTGPYDATGYVYQAFAAPPIFADNNGNNNHRCNLGVWVVHDEACGMGIREDDDLIISNRSRFVPHIFE